MFVKKKMGLVFVALIAIGAMDGCSTTIENPPDTTIVKPDSKPDIVVTPPDAGGGTVTTGN